MHLAYTAPPTEADLNKYGLTLADYEDEPPEEIPMDESMSQSWDVFCALSTQWRSAGAGAYGLDYNVLPMLFRIYKIEDEELALNDVRMMETTALYLMNKK